MLKYKLYQDNRSNAQHKGNWYAHMNLDGTMGLDELAAHMSDHGTPYSKGVICGVLNDMVGCIKELVLEGNAVKLDNLAIFSVGIESKPANTKEEFNARTQNKAGKVLPVVITYYTDKSFSFVIKTPPAAVQLLEAAKVKSGSGEPNRKKVASVTWEQVKAIAEDKLPDLNCFTVESAMKLVAGTARSMGITVKGDFPGK